MNVLSNPKLRYTPPSSRYIKKSKVIDNKDILFAKINRIEHFESTNIFKELVEVRKKQLSYHHDSFSGNLADLFSDKHLYYQCIFNTSRVDLSSTVLQLEQKILSLFENIFEAWAEYELYKIVHSAELMRSINNEITSVSNKSEIIEDISLDNRLVNVADLSTPLSLSNAIVYQNIKQFVQGMKWYEMLFELDISRHGRHFIYTKQEKKSGNHFPTLIASGLIRNQHEIQKWLSFCPFFMNSTWKPVVNIQLLTKLAARSDIHLSSDMLKQTNEKPDQFAHIFLNHVKQIEQPSELIRLTLSGCGRAKFYNFYDTLKAVAKTQLDAGQKISYWITDETPLFLMIEAASKLIGDSEFFLPISVKNTSSSIKTFKGICFNERLHFMLSKIPKKMLLREILRVVTERKKRR